MKISRLLKKQMDSFALLVAAKDTMLRIILSRYRKIEHRGSTRDLLTQTSATRRGHRAGTTRAEARGMTEGVVKEMAKGRRDLDLLRPVPLPEEVFLLVSAVIRALMALDVVNCDTISENAVRKFQILTLSHAANIILVLRSSLQERHCNS